VCGHPNQNGAPSAWALKGTVKEGTTKKGACFLLDREPDFFHTTHQDKKTLMTKNHKKRKK